ncbi:hypothetical protein RGU70_13620 [Herbaspirillum sp. RTI4]|uniref:hypothetical protein n=1 Tax=Herbaspirillum sp. RTI4 TaxID=3048640 RepID=UPI002AB3A4AD|nr:hypothetical protein [Herbaspirillum sp. RTI4]MDY7579352.1 hypothetical protein [Herbaspirillum sp. RTI4]MEA9980266.1 hypothetical protein [Herbaspirillum sp. RTI4]
MGANVNEMSGLLATMGAGTKAAGASNAASAQQASLGYQASVAANNAIIAQDKASITQDNGQIAVQNQDLKTAQTFGMQRAGLAANGVDLGSGSANDILTSTTMMGARDADQLQTNAMREAWGYSTQAADDTNNAKALTSMQSSINPTNAGLTSLMGSASPLSSAWRTFNTATNGATS